MEEIDSRDSSQKKDGRYLIRVTDEKMARQMQLIMKMEGLTQQEYLDKYHKPHMPITDWEIAHRYYEDFIRQFLKIFRPSRARDEVREALFIFWYILMGIYRHTLDGEKVKNRLDQITKDDTLRPDRSRYNLDTTHPMKE